MRAPNQHRMPEMRLRGATRSRPGARCCTKRASFGRLILLLSLSRIAIALSSASSS
jgi:hypothetical protein